MLPRSGRQPYRGRLCVTSILAHAHTYIHLPRRVRAVRLLHNVQGFPQGNSITPKMPEKSGEPDNIREPWKGQDVAPSMTGRQSCCISVCFSPDFLSVDIHAAAHLPRRVRAVRLLHNVQGFPQGNSITTSESLGKVKTWHPR
jgi:hypothetical protein